MDQQTDEQPKRRRAASWSEERAREVIREWGESGLSGAAYARLTSISENRLSYWKRRLAGDEKVVEFVPVPVDSSGAKAIPTASARIEIEHAGVTVRVREDLDVEHVARLVVAVGRRAGRC